MVEIRSFYDKQTNTLTYVVSDPKTKDSIVIDPVLDYELTSGNLSTTSIDPVIEFLNSKKLTLLGILETHAHADHLSSAQVLKTYFPNAKLAIGKNITKVQSTFSKVLQLSENFKADGSQFDRLFIDGERVAFGSLQIEIRNTPGHTPACVSYIIEDNVFTGDALFMPDFGVGRCDFPDGSAETLYDSITKKIYTLPNHFKTYTGHDYQPGGRELRYQSTIEEQKNSNIHLKESTTKDAFVKFRTERDKTLSPPKLLVPSIRFNIVAGKV